MHRSHFADRVRAFLLAAALVSALICPQARLWTRRGAAAARTATR